MTGAAQRTFGVVELAEPILLDVDIKTLLHAQRVCKQWRLLIQESKLLRQKLFLESNTATTISFKVPVRQKRSYDPWQRHISRKIYAFQEAKWHKTGTRWDAGLVMGNPFARNNITSPCNLWQISNDTDGYEAVSNGTAAWERPEASFHQMLICQPPTKNACVYRLDTTGSPDGALFVTASGTGVTIGDIYDAIKGENLECLEVSGYLVVRDWLEQWQWADQDKPVLNSFFRPMPPVIPYSSVEAVQRETWGD